MKTVITVKIIHSKEEIEKAASRYAFDDDCVLAAGREGASVKEAFKAGVDWVLKKLEEDNN